MTSGPTELLWSMQACTHPPVAMHMQIGGHPYSTPRRRSMYGPSAYHLLFDMLMHSVAVAQGMDSMLCGQVMALGPACFKGTWEG